MRREGYVPPYRKPRVIPLWPCVASRSKRSPSPLTPVEKAKRDSPLASKEWKAMQQRRRVCADAVPAPGRWPPNPVQEADRDAACVRRPPSGAEAPRAHKPVRRA